MRRIVLAGSLSIALLIAWWLSFAPTRAASTIMVTTTADTLDNTDGLCSLREAVIAANSDSAVGGCPSGSGVDTIQFNPALAYPATFVLTRSGANEDSSLTGDLDISGTLTISGSGASAIIVDGYGADRVFDIFPAARVTISGVTIRNGNPGGGASGGGVVVGLTGILTLTSSAVENNMASTGGGIRVLGSLRLSDSVVQSNHGGGIRNDGGGLTLRNVNVIGNTGGYGVDNRQGSLSFNGGLVIGNQGGVYNYNSFSGASLSNLTIMGNSGSGVYNTGGPSAVVLTLSQSQVMSNTAPAGAGVRNDGLGATMNIYNTRIANNTATGSAGGVWNYGAMTIISSTVDHNLALSGAGIRNNKGSLYLTNDTISFNTASDNGGGIYSEASATLVNVTVDSNRTNGDPGTGGSLFVDNSSMSLKNTIVSGGGAEGNCGYNLPAFLISVGHNLDSDITCGLTAAGDFSNANPLLGSLQDNGGATPTQALEPGSPAIDHGMNSSCPSTDQRGLARPQGAACDIGAYEAGGSADLSISSKALPDLIGVGERLTYSLAINNWGPSAAMSVTLTDTLPTGVSFVASNIGGGTCAYVGIVICNVPSLSAGAGVTATVVVTVPHSPGVITNTAQVAAATPDLKSDNNTVLTFASVSQIHRFYLPVILVPV